MANEKLNVDITANNKQFVEGVRQASSEATALKRNLKGVGQSSRSADIALTQIARGAADARYGMFAVANNAESLFLALGNVSKQAKATGVSMSKQLGSALLGPTGIVAALVVLINYGPEIYRFFRNMVSGAGEAEASLKKLRKEYAELTAVELTREEKLIKNITQQIKDQEAIIKDVANATHTITNQMGMSYTVSRELTEEEEAKLEVLRLQLGIDKERLKQLLATEAARKKADAKAIADAERLKELRDQADIAEFAAAAPDADDPYLKYGDQTHLGLLAAQFGVNPNEPVIQDVVDVEDDIEALEDLESALRMVGSALAGLTEVEIADYLAKQEEAKRKTEAFAGALINSFDAATSSGGNFLQNLGKGLLSAIGTFLIAEGTAAVLSGSTKIASGFLGAWGLTQVQAGYAEIAGGVALKAGASSIGNGGRSAASASGASSSSRAAIGAGPSSASAFQDTVPQQEIVGKVSGQDLRLILQRADDSYLALS